MNEMTALESTVFFFAIEHGDAMPYSEVKKNEAGDLFKIEGYRIPKIVQDHDEAAMRAYLEAAVKLEEPHRFHRGRTPAVCCSVSDMLGQAHPFVGECVETGEVVCSREDCAQHLEHHERAHPSPPGQG